MDQIPIMPRGYGKSVASYFRGLTVAYLKGDISREDYLAMIAAARVDLLHQDYNETYVWLEKMLETDTLDFNTVFDWMLGGFNTYGDV